MVEKPKEVEVKVSRAIRFPSTIIFLKKLIFPLSIKPYIDSFLHKFKNDNLLKLCQITIKS